MPYQGRLPYTYKSPFNTTLDQGTQTVPSLAFLGDTNNGLFSPATDNVAITTNGSEKLRVTSGGFVGIGTTNPAARLQVQGDIYLSGSIRSASNVQYSFNPLSWQLLGGGYITESNTTNGYIQIGEKYVFGFDVPTGGKINLQTNGSSFFTGGNVGIGTTNPVAKLQVEGNILTQLLNGSPYIISRGAYSDNTTYTFYNNDTTGFTNPSAGTIGVKNSGTYTLTFTSNNNVGIGVTGTSDKLHVVSSGNYTIRTGSTTIVNPNNTGSEIIGVQISVGGNIVLSERQPHTAFSDRTDLAIITNTGYGLGQSEKIRIKAEGLIGIGITTPIRKIDFGQSVANDPLFIRTYGFNDNFWTGIGMDSSNAGIRMAGDPSGGSTLIDVGHYSNDAIHTWYSKLIVKTSGNVGIGTVSPTNKLHVYQGSGDSAIRLTTAFGSGTEYDLTVGGNGNYSPGVFAIRYNTNGTTPFIIEPAGHVTPGADATQNLGSSTKRWANIYSADLQLSNEGSSNDVDGTWGAYTIQEGENDLYLLNRRNGKKYKFVLQEVN